MFDYEIINYYLLCGVLHLKHQSVAHLHRPLRQLLGHQCGIEVTVHSQIAVLHVREPCLCGLDVDVEGRQDGVHLLANVL